MELKMIGEIVFSLRQREAFKRGALRDKWVKQYPELFDEDDVRITQNQNDKHFFEWLAAVVIYNTTGYLSLIEKYEFHNHNRKRRIIEKMLDKEQISILESGKNQCPDLFVYAPDYTDWFFCEVKGNTDRLRESQEKYFKRLMETTDKPVFLIKFKNK
jgi:hypothetical protein